MSRIAIALLTLPLLWGCGGSDEAGVGPSHSGDAQPLRQNRIRSLKRAEVIRVVDAGLGHFLQRVTLEPSLHGAAFEGFRIVELHPPEWWRGVDLAPGDVVIQINGRPIERPDEAHSVFESLRTAPELRVDYLREGEPRTLVLEIRG